MAAGDVYWSSPRHIVRFGPDGTVLGIRRPSRWDGVSHFTFDDYWGASVCGSDGRIYSLCDVVPVHPGGPDDAWGEIYQADSLILDGLWGESVAGGAGNDISSLTDVVVDWSDTEFGLFWIVGDVGGFDNGAPDAYDFNCWKVTSSGSLQSRHYFGSGSGEDRVTCAAMARGSTTLYVVTQETDDTIVKFDTITGAEGVLHDFDSFSVTALAAAQDGTVYAWYQPDDAVVVLNSSGTVIDAYKYDNGDWNGDTYPGGTDRRVALDADETHLLVAANGDSDSIWRINRATRAGNQDPWATTAGIVDSAGWGVDFGNSTGLWAYPLLAAGGWGLGVRMGGTT